MATQVYQFEGEDARLRTLLDNSVDGILVLDREGRIRFANPAAARLWQLAPEALLEAPFGFPLVADSTAILDLPRADGTPRVVELHVVEISWEGAPAYLVTLHDITARAREAERLRRINECFLNFTADHAANINRLTALVGEQLNADVALYNRLERGLLCALGQWRTPSDFKTEDQPEGHICYDVIRRASLEPTVLQRLQASPYADSDASVRPFGLQTYVGQPVRRGGQAVGALCVVYQRDFYPDEADLKFLQLVANAIGVEEERWQAREALEAAKAEQERLAKAEHEQRVLAEALRDAAAALNSNLELEAVLEKVLIHVVRVVPHEGANIMLLDERTQQVSIRSARSYIEQPARPLKDVLMLDDLPGLYQMTQTRKAHLIPDTSCSSEWVTFPEVSWIRSYLGMPLFIKGRVAGFLNLYATIPNFFTPAQVEHLRAFCDQVGIALENAQLYAALRQSEQNLKDAQRIAQLGHWEFDLHDNRLTWSDTIYEIFELDPQNFTPSYTAFLTLVHPDDREQVNQAYRASLKGQQPYNIEHRVQLPNGRIKWVHEACRTDYDAQGQPWRSVGIVQDITERKKAEAALLRNEMHLKTLVKILQQPAVSIQDYLDYVLEETLRLTESKIGYIYYYDEKRREFTLNSWSQKVLQECQVADPQICYALDETGLWGEAVRQQRAFIVNDFQAQHPLKKGYPPGHVSLHRYMTTPIFNDGKIVGVIGVANKDSDYTESDLLQLQLLMDAAWKVVARLQAEQALRESKALLDTTGQLARVGGWELDAATRTVRWTTTTYHIHEVPLEYQPSLEDALAFYPPEERATLIAALERALTAGEPFDLELRFITAQGRALWTRAICHPQMVNGQVVKLVGAFQDVTERKQAELKLQEYAEQLEQLVKAKIQELEQEHAKVIQAGKLASLGEMATGVAHELNQPLTSLLLDAEYLGVLAGQALSAEGGATLSLQEVLEISQNQIRDIERCRHIINHLRTFGRVFNEQPRASNVNRVIEDVFTLIGQRLRDHNVKVQRLLDADLPLVLAHPQKLEQVFLNLISNAEYALEEMRQRVQAGMVERPDYEKVLRIRSYVEGQQVCVEIQDNGCGMPPEHLERLFEPFFTTKPVGKGTGLGLSISYGIITEFGGEITCESAVNEGTTFTVRLPIAGET